MVEMLIAEDTPQPIRELLWAAIDVVAWYRSLPPSKMDAAVERLEEAVLEMAEAGYGC